MVRVSSKTERPLLLISNRPWNAALAERLRRRLGRCVESIDTRAELTREAVERIDPQWIFVPHWSYMIPKEIWGQWPTVIFHMTDLPYGRGGSPLQNLITLGAKRTAITALMCREELDAGDVYIKHPLELHGSAEEIFIRADSIIEKMIVHIVIEEPTAYPQAGKATLFRRRNSSESNLSEIKPGDINAWYDHIRMLDAEGYPHAFIEVHDMRLEFRRVNIRSDGLHADVRICPVISTDEASTSSNPAL